MDQLESRCLLSHTDRNHIAVRWHRTHTKCCGSDSTVEEAAESTGKQQRATCSDRLEMSNRNHRRHRPVVGSVCSGTIPIARGCKLDKALFFEAVANKVN